MSYETEAQMEAGVVTEIANHWWVLLFSGLISIIIGIFAVMQPESAVKILALIFAIWLLVSGLFSIARGFAPGLSGGLRALSFIGGGLSLILGFVALRAYFETDSPLLAGWILAIFIGISFLFRGLSELMAGIEAKGQPGRGWLIFSGIIVIIGGIIVLTVPLTIVALAWVVGIWLIVMGIFQIISSFTVKKAAA